MSNTEDHALAPLPPVDLVSGEGDLLMLDDYPTWNSVKSMPLRVAVQIAIPGLNVRGLQQLQPGQILVSDASAAEHVPVQAGGALIAWAEFDSVDGQMAVRITRGA